MFLALREIRHQPSRFVPVVVLVALVAYVTFFVAALALGLAHSYRAVLEPWDADGVVLTEVSNENLSASRLTQEQVEAAQRLIASAPGGAEATSLVAQAGVAELTDVQGQPPQGPASQVKSDVYAFGTDLGGPLSPVVTQGSAITDPATQVLIDDSLLKDGWDIGDHLQLAGTDQVWTVVGLTHDLTFQTAGVVTVDARALVQAAGENLAPSVNALVVTGASWSEPPEALVRSLSEDGLNLLSLNGFISTLSGYSAQVLTFSLMVGSLIIIATLVLAIFVYVLTLQKRSVLGVLKARGVPTRYLVAAGGAQTALLSATGVLLALLLTLLTGLLLPDAVPFRLSPVLDAAIASAFLLGAVLGGLVSVRGVARIDPAEAIA